MRTAIVNFDRKTVTIEGNTINFTEAGLTDNSDVVAELIDREEIQEYLEDQGYEVEFQYDSQLTLDEFIAHFGWNPTEDKELNISQDATYEIRNGIAAVHVGNQQFGTFEW